MHFYRPLKSSLRNTVNVWDQMSPVISRSLEHFGWYACGWMPILLGRHYILPTKTTSIERDWDWILKNLTVVTEDSRKLYGWYSRITEHPTSHHSQETNRKNMVGILSCELVFDRKIAENFGYVSSVEAAYKLIAEFETRSTTKFSCFKVDKDFGNICVYLRFN